MRFLPKILVGILLAIQILAFLLAGFVLLAWLWESGQPWPTPSRFYLFRFFVAITAVVCAAAARSRLAQV